jgi:hypothetical protein
MENRAYQRKLERMVDELTLALEAQRRELDALTEILEYDLGSSPGGKMAATRLGETVAGFSSVLEKLASLAKNAGPDEGNPRGE